PPFTGPSMAAVLSRQVLDPVPSLTTFRPGVPASLRRAIDRALAKVPAERYGSVLEFLTALEAPDAPAAEPKRSIVVLPFANLSPDPDNAYFRSEEHTSELQSRFDLVCRLLLEKK